FTGYSVRSGFNEQEDSVRGRARLVDWTSPDATTPTGNAPTGNEKRSFDSSTLLSTAPVGTSSEVGENGESAKFDKKSGNGENSGGGEGQTTASRSKTPILRDEPVATAQNGGSLAGALVSTFGALAVVLGAFFALVALLKRTGANGGGVGSALEIVDSTPVGEKARLLTIRWGNRLILAAKTPEKIASLAEITDVDEASALLAEIERRKENAKIGNVGEKTAAIWKRGRDAASVWRTAFGTKGRRR
ncbi:MAG: FliO/MopB family protein, partial [Thermoguttaceae bacterium]|nr:FliO/MopB family protein [Thermoguttaceae bacterium]